MSMLNKNYLLETPLGKVEFYLKLKPREIGNLEYDIIGFTPDHKIPNKMSVLSRHAVLLKVRALSRVSEVSFLAKWNPSIAIEPGVESGEYLEAQSWENKDYMVMIGTEDKEIFEHRRKEKINFPFVSEGELELKSIVYSTEGFEIKLKNIPEKSRFSLQFLVACNQIPEPISGSCWFAVDIPHSEILYSFEKKG